MSAPSPTSPEVAAARSRMAQLNVEIEQLRRSLKTRLAERKQCRDVLARYKYPILTLPTEITSEIFTHFVPPYTELAAPTNPDSPVLLLSICHQWRDIARRTPALWSSMQVVLDDDQLDIVHEQQLRLLEIWLKRSRNCPLSIRLADTRLLPVSASFATTKFVEAILRHASRWQHVEIEVPYENLRALSAPMPLLRSIGVGPIEGILPDTTPSATAVRMFASAPNLKTVLLAARVNSFTIILPWSQITTLTASVYVPEAIHVLHQTTALETCTLSIFDQKDPVSGLSIVPPLPVRALTLRWASAPNSPEDDTVQLVNALTLPALDTLQVSEVLLGSDPIAALSRLRPQGYPRKMEILEARLSLDVYKAAFPNADLSVSVAEVSDTESEY